MADEGGPTTKVSVPADPREKEASNARLLEPTLLEQHMAAKEAKAKAAQGKRKGSSSSDSDSSDSDSDSEGEPHSASRRPR